MHLLSCEYPQRVFNKYSQEYVWVPCGKCNICKNRRAAHYTNLLERERSQHLFTFFVTLTYADEFLPHLDFGDFVGTFEQRGKLSKYSFVGNRSRDGICIPFTDLFPYEKYKDEFHPSDIKFFIDYMKHGGLPVVSKSDAQLFLKRLNKYAHDHITHKFKNFRYFLVSEYGCTTFRPHFHAIFFVDHPQLADRFADCISACWQYGLNDTQFVENSACAYVAQYINKFSDLPYVYRNKCISPFFLCSRNPFIGAFSQCTENDKEIIDLATPTTYGKRKVSDVQFSDVPLEQAYQNRLFPKCPCFGTLSDSLRIELYTITCRFSGKSCKEFMNQIYDYITEDWRTTEFSLWLRSKLSFSKVKSSLFQLDHRNPWVLFDEYSFNFLRRLYYVSRKVACQACQYGLSLLAYIHKIFDYYSNKEKYLLKKQYEYQEQIALEDSDSIATMYPQYLLDNGLSLSDYINELECQVCLNQIADAEYFAMTNKKAHFKNAYLDSRKFRESHPFIHKLILNYYYAKKCNEAFETIAT